MATVYHTRGVGRAPVASSHGAHRTADSKFGEAIGLVHRHFEGVPTVLTEIGPKIPR